MAMFLLTNFCSKLQRACAYKTTLRNRRLSLHSSRTDARSKSSDTAIFEPDFSEYEYSLPDETMYIMDGTAMLFRAYFSRENRDQYKSEMISRELVSDLIEELSLSADDITQLKLLSTSNDPFADESDVVPIACGSLITMALSFARFIRDVQPKYVAVVFDAGREATFRRLAYPSYKKNRPPAPVDLIPLFDLAPRIFTAMGCKCFMEKGFEADDLMATIGKWGKLRGLNCVHISNDKDMLQLIDSGVHVMSPADYTTIIGKDEVLKKYGVPPEHFQDLQALMGDSADNIPGVKGVGIKTAKALIGHFHSVDGLFTRLGMLDLPRCPGEFTDVSATNKHFQAHLIEQMGADSHADAVKELDECLHSLTAKSTTVLGLLYKCGYSNLTLYRYLATLRDDVTISYAYMGLPNPAVEDGAGIRVGLSMNNRRVNAVAKDSIVEVEIDYSVDVSSGDSSYHGDIHVDGTVADTSFFRYKGEHRHEREEVEAYLSAINPKLLQPLQLLRQQYHKLDRS